LSTLPIQRCKAPAALEDVEAFFEEDIQQFLIVNLVHHELVRRHRRRGLGRHLAAAPPGRRFRFPPCRKVARSTSSSAVVLDR
jgi:hypothetical protein